MGNLISRPSCLGQKSKQVRSDENFLKECYQRKRERPPSEHHGELKREEGVRDRPQEEADPEMKKEKEREVEQMDKEREEAVRTPVSDKPLRCSPAPTIMTTSSLDNTWLRSSPSPIKSSRNGTITRKNVPPEFGRSPLTHPGLTSAERRASFQKRDSREGSPWSWKTLASREVTEVTEVTETVVTEIVEVTEYPLGDKGGDPIVTRTVRVLNGAAEDLAEVNITRPQLTSENSVVGTPIVYLLLLSISTFLYIVCMYVYTFYFVILLLSFSYFHMRSMHSTIYDCTTLFCY